MAVYTLDIEEDFDFDIVGISSHEKPYRLAWSLNKGLGWKLVRKDDLMIRQKTGYSEHGQFRYVHPTDNSVITMIDNKTSGGLFIPELSQFDFIVKIENDRFGCDDHFLKRLRSCSFVITAFVLQVEKIKSKHNLVFEYR